jgi:hypothetical protein
LAAIAVDAMIIDGLFDKIKLPPKYEIAKARVKKITLGLYTTSTSYTLGSIALATKSRLRGEFRQALRTCR